MVGYASVQALGLANAEIGREQAARTIGELKPAGIELRSYGAMPIDGSRPPSLRHGRPDASVAAAACVLAAPAAALHALAACGEPEATVVVVEHEAGKGPRDKSDLRKFMSNCEVGGVQWRKRDPLGKYNWALNGLVAWTGRGERSEGISSPARFGRPQEVPPGSRQAGPARGQSSFRDQCKSDMSVSCVYSSPATRRRPHAVRRACWSAEGSCRVWAGVP